jgi:putative SOS response-associated peptidase YedK
MCNRYQTTTDQAGLVQAYGIDAPYAGLGALPSSELFPKRLAWVVRKVDGKRRLDVMAWGFPPPGDAPTPVTNVRNLSSPFWRKALSTPAQRCLVPVTAFCEWEGQAGAKVARWFRVPSRPLFCFAGIWRQTEGGQGVYAFLTCEPNALVAKVHPKAMPVILHPEDEEKWLTGTMTEILPLAAPYPSQLMAIP